MQNELNDSLLSAYLDDQLTGEERAAVEAKLRESAEHRQTLAELRSLRESFQALPRYQLGDDFSGRVIEAALAAEAQQNTANEPARTPLGPTVMPVERTPASRTNHRLAYAAGAIAAVAACLLVVVQLGGGLSWGPEGEATPDGPPVAINERDTPAELPAFAALRQALPEQGEALIVRVRVPAGTKPAAAIDAALAQSGIRQLTPSEPTSAGRVGAAYRTALREQAAGSASPAAVESASDALYVEAPLGLVEDALAVLADQEGGQLDLRPEMTVAVASTTPGSRSVGEGEGEGGSAAEQSASKEPFAQRLNPRMFQLPKTPAAGSDDEPVAGTTSVDPNRKVRVLILVETVK